MRTLILVILLALVFPGCLEQPVERTAIPTAPTITRVADAGDFMPMAPGNHWTYDRTFTTTIIPDDGPPGPPETFREQVHVDHIEYRTIGDHDYVLEREVYSNEPGENQRLRRQDRAGYYILERSKDEGKTSERPVLSSRIHTTSERLARRHGADPASVRSQLARFETIRRALCDIDVSPPGGVESGEIQTLAYPLHPGATWDIRRDLSFVATVEAHEQLHGFSAWRVRIDSELLDENDYVHVWYSRCGEVGSHIHFEGGVTNESGEYIGTMVADDVEVIVDAQLQRGGCDVEYVGDVGGGGSVGSYPLSPGNRWTYRIDSSLDGTPAGPPEIVDDVQEQWVDFDGTMYIEQVMRPHANAAWTTVSYMREDRDGLYRLDPPVVGAARHGRYGGFLFPTGAGPEAHEAIVLTYPLKVGDSWTMRDAPGIGVWTVSVEGRERVVSPVGGFQAFRLRIEHPFMSPGDEVLLWYAREGMVKAYQRVQTDDGLLRQTWELIEFDIN